MNIISQSEPLIFERKHKNLSNETFVYITTVLIFFVYSDLFLQHS